MKQLSHKGQEGEKGGSRRRVRPHGVIPPPFQPFLNKLPPSPPPVRPSVPPLRHFLYASQENNFSPFHPFLLFSLSLSSAVAFVGATVRKNRKQRGNGEGFCSFLPLPSPSLAGAGGRGGEKGTASALTKQKGGRGKETLTDPESGQFR